MRKWTWPSATTLFGDTWRMEPPDQRPDLRHVVTLAVEIERAQRAWEAIQADPFQHLPAGLRCITLAGITGKQERSGVFADQWRHVPERSVTNVSNRRARRLANAERILRQEADRA